MTKSELPRFENLALLARGGQTVHLKASAGELEALAGRADIPGLKALSADLRVKSLQNGVYQVEGGLKGKVILQSARTLKEFETAVEDTFLEGFIEKRIMEKMSPEEAEAYDEFEVFGGEDVDLGEMVAQLFILAIDPFPHPEGEKAEENPTSGVSVISEKTAKAKSSPFSELKKLQKKA